MSLGLGTQWALGGEAGSKPACSSALRCVVISPRKPSGPTSGLPSPPFSSCRVGCPVVREAVRALLTGGGRSRCHLTFCGRGCVRAFTHPAARPATGASVLGARGAASAAGQNGLVSAARDRVPGGRCSQRSAWGCPRLTPGGGRGELAKHTGRSETPQPFMFVCCTDVFTKTP